MLARSRDERVRGYFVGRRFPRPDEKPAFVGRFARAGIKSESVACNLEHRPSGGVFKPPKNARNQGDAVSPTSLGSEEHGALYEVACRRIVHQVVALHAADGPLETTRHLSVFGLAPIPMLVMLGHAIGNKVAADFYQCHRDKPRRWTW